MYITVFEIERRTQKHLPPAPIISLYVYCLLCGCDICDISLWLFVNRKKIFVKM